MRPSEVDGYKDAYPALAHLLGSKAGVGLPEIVEQAYLEKDELKQKRVRD